MAEPDDDPIRGKTHRWTFTDGPTAGKTYEHTFNKNGTVLSGSGYTLTVVLNFGDHGLVGFASNDKEWYPLKGTFEPVP